MKPIYIIEFIGMPGSGKTFLATLIKPYLQKSGFEAHYLIHNPFTRSTYIIFHIKRLVYTISLFIRMPMMVILIGYSTAIARPQSFKKFLGVFLNITYKLGFIFTKQGILVLDEGLVHAMWAVWAVSKSSLRFPQKLCDTLVQIMSQHKINIVTIKVIAEPAILMQRFKHRVEVLGNDHDLAPRGKVNYHAFKVADSKYLDSYKCFVPHTNMAFEISNNKSNDDKQVFPELKELAQSITRWQL